jgi:hypothetical protein
MAAKNRLFTMTQGAYGTEMGFNLYEAGSTRFTITTTVKIYVKRHGATTNVIDGAVCNTAGPFTIEGKAWDAKYSFTNAEMDLAAGTYLFRFQHGTSAPIDYFPTDPTRYEGKIVINPAP